MAGIGFQLKKKLLPGTLTGVMQGYGYAAMISSGPWIISIVSLAILGVLLTAGGFTQELDLFFVFITHIYGASLILTGPVQMVMTRFAADQHFKKDEGTVFPALMTSLAVTSFWAGMLALPVFLLLTEGALVFRLSSAFFFVILCCIWMTTVFLTSLKDYNAVLRSFAVGYAISFSCAWCCAVLFGGEFTMLGYVLGQVTLLLMFLKAVYDKFGSWKLSNWDFLPYFKSHWPLAVIGFFYNLGMWSDKFIYWWFSSVSIQISGFFYAAPIYDAAVYLSFLSVVPGMAVFLIKLETDYAENYERFFHYVINKGTLSEIFEAKRQMVSSLREGLAQLLKVQALVTGCLALFAEQILGGLKLGALQTGVFQVTLVGVFFLVIFLSMLTMLFYLNQLRHAAWSCVCFCVVNILCTSFNVVAGEQWYGTGFVAATLAALALSTYFVNLNHRLLEYNTFAPQQIGG